MSHQVEVSQCHPRKNLTFGLILVAVGTFFLLDRLELIDASQFWQYWPALIALSGAIKILSAKHPSHIIQGCVEIVVAFWLYASIEHLWGWSFHTSWPIFLIVIGVSTIARGFFTSNK